MTEVQVLCEVRGGSTIASVNGRIIVTHPEEKPYFVNWDGSTEVLEPASPSRAPAHLSASYRENTNGSN